MAKRLVLDVWLDCLELAPLDSEQQMMTYCKMKTRVLTIDHPYLKLRHCPSLSSAEFTPQVNLIPPQDYTLMTIILGRLRGLADYISIARQAFRFFYVLIDVFTIDFYIGPDLTHLSKLEEGEVDALPHGVQPGVCLIFYLTFEAFDDHSFDFVEGERPVQPPACHTPDHRAEYSTCNGQSGVELPTISRGVSRPIISGG